LSLGLPDLIFEARAGAGMVLERLVQVCGRRLHIRIDVD
jgi:hypothetical protein